jgi:putative ABC transport system substrate-binding protein
MNRPEGNLTGVTTLNHKLVAKRVELMHEVVRGARSIALLVNPTSPSLTKIAIEDAQAAARTLGLQLHTLNASTEPELDAAFANFNPLRPGGLVIGTDAFFTSRLERIAALALRHRVPAVYHFREFTAAGGLLSYGGSITDAFRETGVYVARILKGERPANLPVQQVTNVELYINLKTARALGIDNVPNTLLARANEVIE